MNENIDLTKILKDCPKGFELYSPLFGNVKLNSISDCYIEIIDNIGSGAYFNKLGQYVSTYEVLNDCLLFPSKEQRDWNKFIAPWYKKKPKFKVGDKIVNLPMKYMRGSWTQGTISKITDDKYIFTDGSYISISSQDSWELVHDKKSKFDPKTLQPFDRVLVRDDESLTWKINMFSHIDNDVSPCKCLISFYKYCIPYNDDTKHLVGTTDKAPEYYRYWKE